MPPSDGTLVIENAHIIFRNFSGKEGMYNAEGDRNFCLLLEPELAEVMARDGWNIKTLKPREGNEDEGPQPYVQVSIGYKNRPPRIVMITSKGRTDLGQDELQLLDWVDIDKVDLIIRPYSWNVGGRGGVKAYLKSFFVTIAEDPLELKYADVQELPARAGRLEIAAPPDHTVIEGEWT